MMVYVIGSLNAVLHIYRSRNLLKNSTQFPKLDARCIASYKVFLVESKSSMSILQTFSATFEYFC